MAIGHPRATFPNLRLPPLALEGVSAAASEFRLTVDRYVFEALADVPAKQRITVLGTIDPNPALATCACASIEPTLYAPVATTVPEIWPALRAGFVAELDRWLIEVVRHR